MFLRRSNGQRLRSIIFFLSIFAPAVMIQIRLFYILIESPFLEHFKEKYFITITFVVLVQDIKMCRCV